MLNKTVPCGSLCRGDPIISHLFFADNNLLFLKASQKVCEQLKQILQRYEQVSGEKKTWIKVVSLLVEMWSVETRIILQPHWEWGKLTSMTDTWVCLLTLANLWANVSTCLKIAYGRKIQGCIAKLLSFTGKEILLKVVAQAVPIYMMSCFIIPKVLHEEIQQVMASYWWVNKKGGEIFIG